MEIKLLLTLDLREQAALQAALVTHGAPDALVTLALTGANFNVSERPRAVAIV